MNHYGFGNVSLQDQGWEPDYAGSDIKILNSREVKATRKHHACDDCGEQIPVGSPARCVAMINEGKFEVHYSHSLAAKCWASERGAEKV